MEFDRKLALDVLVTIYVKLDGPPDSAPSVGQIRTFLANPNPSPRDLDKPTHEWKIAFGDVERSRALGLALAELLGSGPRPAPA